MAQAGDTPNTDASQAQPAGRGIKILVWGMGAGILVMTALLILGLSLGWHKKGGGAPAPDPTAAAQAAAEGGPVVPLELATSAGSHLAAMSADGTRVVLHVTGPAGDEVIVIDTAHNRVISRIVLKPPGGAAGQP